MIGNIGIGTVVVEPHPPRELDAVDGLHREIGQHEIGLLVAQFGEARRRRRPIHRRADAECLQQRTQKNAHMRIVFDDKRLQMIEIGFAHAGTTPRHGGEIGRQRRRQWQRDVTLPRTTQRMQGQAISRWLGKPYGGRRVEPHLTVLQSDARTERLSGTEGRADTRGVRGRPLVDDEGAVSCWCAIPTEGLASAGRRRGRG